MEYLYEIGFDEEKIKYIIEINNDIQSTSKLEIESLINILKNIECTDNQIVNIIYANPYYLSRSISDVNKLILKLESLGITNLNITFDSNPWILNKDSFEIDDYIKRKQEEGLEIDEIKDLIDSGYIE